MTLRRLASPIVPITGPRAAGLAAPQTIFGGFARPARGCEVSVMWRGAPGRAGDCMSVIGSNPGQARERDHRRGDREFATRRAPWPLARLAGYTNLVMV